MGLGVIEVLAWHGTTKICTGTCIMCVQSFRRTQWPLCKCACTSGLATAGILMVLSLEQQLDLVADLHVQ